MPTDKLPPDAANCKSAFSDGHVSRWSGIPQEGLNDENRLHIEILCESVRCGPWNVPTNWDKMIMVGDADTSFIFCGCLSTFDFDALSRLVILAHDHCVRVSVYPRNFKHLEISMHSRRARRSDSFSIHATLESAIADVRGHNK